MKRNVPILAAAILFAAVTTMTARDVAAQELGRLFLTPDQRSQLDARRKARVPDKPAAVVTESPYTRVDGSVRRSGGRSTVWVNGETIPESAQGDNPRLAPSREPGRDKVSVPVGEAKRRVELRAGEKLDRGTGEVRDVIGSGEIRIRRTDEKAR